MRLDKLTIKRTKRKVPLPLKRIRKEIPPPGRTFKDRKKYNRKEAKEELKRTLSQLHRSRLVHLDVRSTFA